MGIYGRFFLSLFLIFSTVFYTFSIHAVKLKIENLETENYSQVRLPFYPVKKIGETELSFGKEIIENLRFRVVLENSEETKPPYVYTAYENNTDSSIRKVYPKQILLNNEGPYGDDSINVTCDPQSFTPKRIRVYVSGDQKYEWITAKNEVIEISNKKPIYLGCVYRDFEPQPIESIELIYNTIFFQHFGNKYEVGLSILINGEPFKISGLEEGAQGNDEYKYKTFWLAWREGLTPSMGLKATTMNTNDEDFNETEKTGMKGVNLVQISEAF